MIHINRDLPVEEQKFTCAHELGHMLLHSDSNTPFLRVNTLYSIGKFENEANRFAVDLLYSDDGLQDYLSFSVPEIAACLNVSEELIAYRLSVLKEKRQDE
jgi:Zn-dependent peptidase ImmA (M78 family)